MRWWETRGVWGEIMSQLRSFNSTLFSAGLLNRDTLDKANQCCQGIYSYIYLLNEIICEWNSEKSNKIESPTAHFMKVKILIERLRQAEALSHSTHLHLLQTMAKLSDSISALNKLRFQKPPAIHDSLVKFTTLFFMLFFILTISQSTSVIVAIVCPPMVYSILNLVHVFAIRAERPFGKRSSDISSYALVKKSQTEAEVFYETAAQELEKTRLKTQRPALLCQPLHHRAKLFTNFFDGVTGFFFTHFFKVWITVIGFFNPVLGKDSALVFLNVV